MSTDRISLLSKMKVEDTKHAAMPHVLLVLDQFTKTLGGGERIALKLSSFAASIRIPCFDSDLFCSS